MTLIELESISKNKHPVSFIKLDKPEIQHFVPVATRVFFLGKQTVPTLGPSCTGLTNLINAISFLRWDMENPACMIILLTRYVTPSPWIWCAPIEWIRIRDKTEWMIWMLCVHLGYNLATVFYGPLMLMSTGCLAPLFPMAILGAAITLANSIFNIVIVVIYCKTRESTNKHYCCCCFCLN